jgi:hypothetical protein
VLQNYFKTILFLLSFALFVNGYSQEMTPGVIEIRQEVADSVGAFYFYDSALNIIKPRTYQLDTALHHFHHYQSLQRNGRTYASLGNTGLAYTDLLFSNELNPASQFGIRTYDAYRFTPSNLPYYKLNVPFTVLAYTTGRHREQVFMGRHYQQVRRNLGVGIHFNIYNSMGAYVRQKSDNASVAFQALYHTRNQRYGIAANFINNRFVHRENGGLVNPVQFEENIETDRSRISMKLNAAENRWSESNTYFKQYLHLTNPKFLKNDSLSGPFRGLGTLVHTFNYQRLAQVYDDRNPRSGFYREILADSVRTFDSLVLHTVYNQLQWHLPLIQGEMLNFTINAGMGHVFMHYRMHGINKKYNQLIPYFRPELVLGKKLRLEANLQRITGDFRNNDQELGANASYHFFEHDPLILKGQLRRSATSPGLFYHLYQSNHFEWDNSFDQQKSTELKASGQWRKTKAGISMNRLNGLVYLDTLAHPAWHSDPLSVFSVFFDSRLDWRRFTLDNKITFQQLSDESALRLPGLIINSTLAYELDLFQGALQAMGGVELFYNTAWKAPAYMPATRSFYLQNDKETGNYLYADVFINLRIKRARIFLLMQHVNQGLAGFDYYMIPGYPMPDRAFKFGINWMFYD